VTYAALILLPLPKVFSSAFWIISFLPSVVTPLVAKASGSGDSDAIQERIGEAVFIATIMGLLGMTFLTVIPEKVLTLVLSPGAPAEAFALPYLKIRGIAGLIVDSNID
jgi:MATE family multidrug resistance protein